MNYTLIHGDCIAEMKKMQDNSVDFTLTDIPYDGVNRKSNGLRNLDKDKADILTFDLSAFLPEILRVTKNNICIFCGGGQFSEIYKFFLQQNGTVRPLIWQKTNPSPMNGQFVYLSGVEFAVWFKKANSNVFNAHCKNTVFKFPCGSSEFHPTEKNHALLKDLILDNTNNFDTVFDCCMGSGSTGIVAKETNRNFIGIELDEKYFKLAEKRINNTTYQISFF